MTHASLLLDPAFRIGEIDPRIRGSFVEHFGRCVYGGIYEPDHPDADADGFRTDVLTLTRELGVATVRYPGGNFVSGYRWEDGIGPREQRPRRLDLAWRSTESNRVGVDEFTAWCRKAGAEPMMAVNLGTRGVEEAAALVEYCNHPGGSFWSDRRIANGSREPHAIRLWCLGNELDGTWQIGHKTAHEYGRLAAAAAHAMRLVDPSIELVACGSSNRRMPTFASWEAEVLEHTYDVVDYVSLHSYYHPTSDEPPAIADFLAAAVDMDAMIEGVIATADYVRAKLGRSKRINLSFDEWNVWYSQRTWRDDVPDWAEAPPLLEDRYNVMDAVVVGSLLNSLVRHADRVAIACFAQLVNVIAPIMTEHGGPSWKQSTFHPMQQVFAHGRGVALRVEVTSPMVETPTYGEVPQLDCAATHDEETGRVAVFVVNRSPAAALDLEVNLRAVPGARPVEHLMLGGDDPLAANTKDNPDRVVPTRRDVPAVVDDRLRVSLPAMSWHLLRLDTNPA